MTREQKAVAAYGSVLGVTFVLWLTWSAFGAVAVLLLAGAAVTAVLRVSHPAVRRRSTPARPAPGRGRAGSARRPPPPGPPHR